MQASLPSTDLIPATSRKPMADGSGSDDSSLVLQAMKLGDEGRGRESCVQGHEAGDQCLLLELLEHEFWF
jgi:hypothetical protein